MLNEEETQERARYCYLVFYQLSCLAANDSVSPASYHDLLERSTLRLFEDDFISMTLQEALTFGNADEALRYLVTLYEGFTHAFCEILQMPVEKLRDAISVDCLKRLSDEMLFSPSKAVELKQHREKHIK